MAKLDVTNRKVTKTIEIDELVVTLELSSAEAQTLAEILARVGTSQYFRDRRDSHKFGDQSFGQSQNQKNSEEIKKLLRVAGFNWTRDAVDNVNVNERGGSIYFYHEDA